MVISISDSRDPETNTITNILSQDDIITVQKSILDLVACIDRFEYARMKQYPGMKNEIVGWRGQVETVVGLSASRTSSESIELLEQRQSRITEELANLQNTISIAAMSIMWATTDTQEAFGALWNSLCKYSQGDATNNVLRNNCYTSLMYSRGLMCSAMERVKEINLNLTMARCAQRGANEIYQRTLNDTRRGLARLQGLLQQAAVPQQHPVDTVSATVRQIKEVIGHHIPVPDVIVTGTGIGFAWI